MIRLSQIQEQPDTTRLLQLPAQSVNAASVDQEASSGVYKLLCKVIMFVLLKVLR